MSMRTGIPPTVSVSVGSIGTNGVSGGVARIRAEFAPPQTAGVVGVAVRCSPSGIAALTNGGGTWKLVPVAKARSSMSLFRSSRIGAASTMKMSGNPGFQRMLLSKVKRALGML
jgi:hypothetical protein